MDNWLYYLRKGLSRKLPPDRLGEGKDYTSIRANLRNLYPSIMRHWRRGLLGAILILFAALLSFPQPLIYRYLIDDVILGRRLGLLAGGLLLLIGISLAGKVASLFQEFYFTRFEQGVILDIQNEIFERALRFPKTFFDANQTGYLMSRLSSDVRGLSWFFSSPMVHICINLLRFAGGIVFLLYLEWRMAVGVLIILPGMVFLVRFFSHKMHALSRQSTEQHANVSSHIQESLSLASLIKAFSTEGQTATRLMSELKKAFRLSIEQSTVSSVASMAMNSMPGAAGVLALGVGAYWVIQGHWTLGSLMAFQVYLGYVFGPAQSLASANLQLQNARTSLERVSALFDIVPEENLGQGRKVDRLRGEIEFCDVSFSYTPQEPVLKNISFKVHPGERFAIVGPSGVGKTTLLSLILRLYRPSSGEIYFDGLPASRHELASLRRRIGYVSQCTLLPSGTIRGNLCYGNPEAGEEEMIRAAKTAEIHDFITGLPRGYESEVGVSGVNLSEGQKQRLSLARALIKDPDILVLDEPTSALDGVTENSILQSLPLHLRGKTLLIVAHRLSVVRDADRILLLAGNRILGEGTHEFLLRTNGYYRSLAAGQQNLSEAPFSVRGQARETVN